MACRSGATERLTGLLWHIRMFINACRNSSGTIPDNGKFPLRDLLFIMVGPYPDQEIQEKSTDSNIKHHD